MKKCKVYGVGINDANYTVINRIRVDGKYKITGQCPFHRTWLSMLARCYSKSNLVRYLTYKDCLVCEEWLTFSTFKKWMESQDYKGKQLDKDLLVQGNKLYSPETCVFVDAKINTFTVDSAKSRGRYMIGACWYKDKNKFRANCSNPFTGKSDHLGYFTDELSAHLAWKKRKHELACQLADSDLVQDERLAQALRTRYLPDNTQEVKAA